MAFNGGSDVVLVHLSVPPLLPIRLRTSCWNLFDLLISVVDGH